MTYDDFHHWESYYQNNSYENIPWKGNYSSFLEKVLEFTATLPTGKILDVGCGIGEKSLYLAELGFTVWGFDISPMN